MGVFPRALTGKEIKGMQIGQEEEELLLFAYAVFASSEKPKGPQTIKEFNTVAGFRINIQR